MISVENLGDETFNKSRSPTEQKDYFGNRSTANVSGTKKNNLNYKLIFRLCNSQVAKLKKSSRIMSTKLIS